MKDEITTKRVESNQCAIQLERRLTHVEEQLALEQYKRAAPEANNLVLKYRLDNLEGRVDTNAAMIYPHKDIQRQFLCTMLPDTFSMA